MVDFIILNLGIGGSMVKNIKFLFLALFFVSLISAKEAKVKIMFVDTLYGAAIGGAIAGIVILNDSDIWKEKLSLGLTRGAVGGLAIGFVDGFDLLKTEIKQPSRPLLAYKRDPLGKTYSEFHIDVVSVYF